MSLSSPYTIRFLFLKVKIYQTSKDVMTVVCCSRLQNSIRAVSNGMWGEVRVHLEGWNSADYLSVAQGPSSLDMKATGTK
ncbi:hypothetical protein M513_12443 [Trichuris suis]|uniref:Uncharacterized protein n=1 Tax=Trichuris suis TaxID=68888 RepID=A0A085LNX9_9BILA|nr:hypothetical protein M513_12443 [Trichuris suis]